MGFVVSIIGLAIQAYGENRKRKAQKQQQALMEEQRQEELKIQKQEAKTRKIAENRARRERVRQYLVQRGELQNQAANFQVGTSSGAAGGQAALGSQLAGQLGAANQQQAGAAAIAASNERISNLQGGINSAAGKEAQYGQVASIGNTIFSATGGFGESGAIWDGFGSKSEDTGEG